MPLILPQRKLIKPTRRGLIAGAAALIAMPAIVRAQSLTMTGVGSFGAAAGGSVTPVTTGAYQDTSNSTSDFPFTITTLTSGALVAFVSTNDASTPTSVTWDQGGTNQSMTLIATNAGAIATFFYVRLAPTIGTSLTLRVVTSGIVRVCAAIQTFSGVLQSSVAAAFTNVQQGRFQNISDIVDAVSSDTGNYVIGQGFCSNSSGQGPFTADQTQIDQHTDVNNVMRIAMMTPGVNPSANIGFTQTGGGFLLIQSANIVKA